MTFEEFFEFARTLDVQSLGSLNWDSDLVKSQFRELFDSSGHTNKKTVRAFFAGKHPCETAWSPDFWAQRGWSPEEAAARSSAVQSENNERLATKKVADPVAYSNMLPMQLGYWLKRGHTREEARALVAERQACFSYAKLVKKYGEEVAREKLHERNLKWVTSLGVESTKGWTNGRRYSEASCSLFESCFDDLRAFRTYLGSRNKEFSLSNERHTFYYDFVVVDLRLVFEYQGTRFHPSPRLTCEERAVWKQVFSKKTADEVDAYDLEKRLLAEQYGYEVHYVYDDASVFDNREAVKRAVDRALSRTS